MPGTDNNWISYYEVFRNGIAIDRVAKGTYYFDHSAGGDLAAKYEVRTVDGAGNASGKARLPVPRPVRPGLSTMPRTPTFSILAHGNPKPAFSRLMPERSPRPKRRGQRSRLPSTASGFSGSRSLAPRRARPQLAWTAVPRRLSTPIPPTTFGASVSIVKTCPQAHMCYGLRCLANTVRLQKTRLLPSMGFGSSGRGTVSWCGAHPWQETELKIVSNEGEPLCTVPYRCYTLVV